MPSAIVTGATGFIGRHLCSLLTDSGWKVTACARVKQKGPWHQFVEWNISEHPLQASGFPKSSIVFHLASKAHALSEVAEDYDEYRKINVTGTQHSLELAHRIASKRIVYFSSVKAMGEGNADYSSAESINESFSCNPAGPYGASKLEAEELIRSANNSIQTTIIRPTMVYGSNSKGNLIKMVDAIRRNRFPPLPEFGNRRSMVNVDDLCSLAIKAATSEQAAGKTYIASEPEAYSTKVLYEMICIALGKSPARWGIPHAALKGLGRLGDLIGKLRNKRFVFDSDSLRKLSSSALYDGSKCCRDLDFVYKYRIKEVLPEMIDSIPDA